MRSISLRKTDNVRRKHRQTHDNHTAKVNWIAERRWRCHRAPPVLTAVLSLFLALLLVGISLAAGVDQPEPAAKDCPCPEITVTNMVDTGAGGNCVDVPPAVIFTRQANNSVYLASRNLCTVSDPTNRNAEWIAIENSGEFEACRTVIQKAANTLGITCTDTDHPTPSQTPTLAAPGS